VTGHAVHLALFVVGLLAVSLLVLPALSPRRRRAGRADRAHRARVAALRSSLGADPAAGSRGPGN
jgi:hypothetical protein